MPKKAISAKEKMDRELLAALAAGQKRLGDRDIDTARIMPNSASTYNRRKHAPETFTLCDLRILAERYQFTDYQACRIIGVKYRGRTLEQEAV